jgi:hypothetical protein
VPRPASFAPTKTDVCAWRGSALAFVRALPSQPSRRAVSSMATRCQPGKPAAGRRAQSRSRQGARRRQAKRAGPRPAGQSTPY